jgi:2-polyprenyl-3-methyl-5-hydroxy-6-metoxy-1,4-benzoquinol methylase
MLRNLHKKIKIYDLLRTGILPISQIDRCLPKEGTIIDLGCGQGIITTYIAQNKSRQVIGVDLDTTRLRQSSSKNLKFVNANIVTYDMKKPSGIVISDVLHHLSYKDQDKLLIRIAKSLKVGGVFVIKEIDTHEFVRSRLSRFWDFVFYPKDKISYSDSTSLPRQLASLGFKVKFQRACRLFPGSTTLYICTKS